MKRLMIRLCLSVAIVVGTLSAFQKPSVVQGQVPEPPNSLEPINVPSPDTVQQLEILRSKKEKYELAISRIEQHLLQELDGTLRITVESAEQLGIEPSTFDELTQSLSTTNEWIRQGIIRPEQVKLKTDFSTIPNSLSRSRYMTFECAGRSGTEYHWWGYIVYLNECQTQVLIGLLTAGAGAAGICAVLLQPAALPCGIASGLAAIGAGVLVALTGAGGNRGIYTVYIYPGTQVYTWHQ